MANENSPMLMREQKVKMRSKNQAFLDFQKNLNSQLDMKEHSDANYISNSGRRLRLHEGNNSIDVNPIMTVDSSVKSVIFKDTPTQSNTVPSSFVDNEYLGKSKPAIPDAGSKQRMSIQKNKFTPSRPGLSMHDITASGDFSKVTKISNKNKSKTVLKNRVSVTQLNNVTINPDPSKGIKASIGGEEFMMYRTNELHSHNEFHPNVVQNEDDYDSVEIELQDEEDFIHKTMQPENSVVVPPKIIKKPVHYRQASRDIEYIELDMFEQYGDKLQDFLKSTPYIDQLIETSKQYRMFIE